MDEDLRRRKLGKFGAAKHVHPQPVMAELRAEFDAALADRLPRARLL